MKTKIDLMDEDIKNHLRSIWFDEGGCKMTEEWTSWNIDEFINWDPDFYKENDIDVMFLFGEKERKPCFVCGEYVSHDYDPNIIRVFLGDETFEYVCSKFQSKIFIHHKPNKETKNV